MVFCLPLAIGLAAIFLSERADSELAYLTTVIAAVSFLVSLVLLPWQLKLLLLALVFVLARRQATSVNRPDDPMHSSRNAEMSLERSPAEPLNVAEQERERVGKYRGATWKATTNVEPIETQVPLADLKYRGASFWNSSRF